MATSAMAQGDSNCRYKILVPSSVAGAVIGKGGEVIGQLQRDSGTRIIMSKVNDFYPGTNERVCVIHGSADGILHVLGFIMEKFRERPDLYSKANGDTKGLVDRERQVKILVPNSTACLIIGDCGSYLKQIADETGAVVQVLQKCDIPVGNNASQERCIIVTGDMNQNKQACRMILLKIIEDPHSGIYSHVNYANVSSSSASSDCDNSSFGSPGVNVNNPLKHFYNSSKGSNVNRKTNTSNITSHCSGPETIQPIVPVVNCHIPLVETVRNYLQNNGMSEHAISEVVSAITTLQSFGILDYVLYLAGAAEPVIHYDFELPYNAILDNSITSLGLHENMKPLACNSINIDNVGFNSINGSPMDQSSNFLQYPESRPQNVFLNTDSTSFEPLYSSSPIASPIAAVSMQNTQVQTLDSSFPLQFSQQQVSRGDITSNDANATSQVEVEVPDTVVCSILGEGAKLLIEIQQLSGANIQITKKGRYSPGSFNRIITISGPLHSVCIAQSLVEQQILEASMKTNQHIPAPQSLN